MKREGRTIVFIDEVGFDLLPAAVGSYAPRGQTPILNVPLICDHRSVISDITLDGWLFMGTQTAALAGVVTDLFAGYG